MSVSSENAQGWGPVLARDNLAFLRAGDSMPPETGREGESPKRISDAKANYPFLHSSFSQCVSVFEIIDFYVLDVIAILLEDLARRALAWAG